MENKILSERNLTSTDEYTVNLSNAVANRAVDYLLNEAGINLINYNNHETYMVEDIRLDYLTSIIAVEDKMKFTLAFSFEKELIEKIFVEYSKGIEIEKEEVSSYIEETAGDMINVVMGNVLKGFSEKGKFIHISVPIIVNEAKSIYKYKNSKFFKNKIKTEWGLLIIYCITPGEKAILQMKGKE